MTCYQSSPARQDEDGYVLLTNVIVVAIRARQAEASQPATA
jgi:hypothetical protein